MFGAIGLEIEAVRASQQQLLSSASLTGTGDICFALKSAATASLPLPPKARPRPADSFMQPSHIEACH